MTPRLPEDLQRAEFELIAELDHSAVVPFVNRQLKRASMVRNLYFLSNILILTFCVALLWKSEKTWLDAISQLFLGIFFGYLLLMPIHENIHALAYRMCGSRSTRVVYQWRQLTALCVADFFVANGKQFAWVCLAPFLIINSVLILLIILFAQPIMLVGMLLLHIGACSGDFGMLNLLDAHRKTGFWTFDDSRNGRTFFYGSAPIEKAPS